MGLAAWAIDELKADAQIIRQAMGSLIGSAGGIFAAGELGLTQKGTPNMSVQVAVGRVWVPGVGVITGPYCVRNSATYEQVIEAAGASEPRIDTIVVRIYDNTEDASGKSKPEIEALKGAEETGVTLANKKGIAAVPRTCYVLGYVLVPAKASSIVTADIENVATVATPGLGAATYLEGTAGARPAAGIAGRIYRATDTKVYSVDTGAAWEELISLGAISVATQTGRALNTKYLPSVSRAVLVTVWVIVAEPFEGELFRKGEKLGPMRGALAEGGKDLTLSMTFLCLAGEEWELKKITGSVLQIASFQAVL